MHPAPVSTFSIVARDPEGGALGVAVQSRYFNVGSVVPWAEADVGAVATQAFMDPGYGPRALAMLRKGASAARALETLRAADPQRELRQVAIVDARGRAAGHTGTLCVPFAGHRTAPGHAVQGNLLASDRVWTAMEGAFRRAREPFALRLVRALEAGQRAGGDARGMQAAALLVVRRVSAEEPWRNRLVDLRVEDHPEPIVELRRLLGLRVAWDALARAQEAAIAGQLGEVHEAFKAGLRASPGNDELLFWGGLALARAGDPTAGLRQLRAAIRKNPRWRPLLARIPPALRPPEAVLERALAEAGRSSRAAAARRARG